MPTSGSLVWDDQSQKYVRRTGPRNPFMGLVGHKGRKRSFADDMWPIKMQPKKGLSGAEKRRKRKGGNPEGGPGNKGFAQDFRHKKSKRGTLVG